MLKFEILKDEDGMKISSYLKDVEKLSSRLVRGAAREQRIKVNGKVIRLSYVVKTGDVIEFDVTKEESQNIEPEDIDIEIVHEDEDIIVLNKPYGMVVHPTKSHASGTLANGLMNYFQKSNQNCIVRLVSRLDMDTSGLIIVAKNQFSHMSLARDMQSDKFVKSYIAVAHGHLEEESGTIDLPIFRPGEGAINRVVDERGQRSVTHYKVVEKLSQADVVELTLETGRTHQIRVHLSHIGHVIYGDSLYGATGDEELITRQALHAYKLSFPHPRTKEVIHLQSGLPGDIENLILKLK